MPVGKHQIMMIRSLDARNDCEGFCGLWRCTKPIDKPDEVSNNLISCVLTVKSS